MHAIPRSTRREFLTGQAVADALVPFDVGGESSLSDPSSQRYLVRLSRRAMACNFEVFLNAGQDPGANTAALVALDLVDRLEDQLSIYRESSELSELNRTAAFMPVEVEPRLFNLLEFATHLYFATNGAFDVTSGRLSQVWGFTRRRGEIPQPEVLAESLACVGSRHLEFNRDHHTVRFLQPGLEINLGSIGKGYALDRCAELLEQSSIHDYLLHGGNSSVLARGSHAGRTTPGWCVGVRNPLRPERRLGQLILHDKALGTSGSGTQFFMHEGRRLGHILDPRTGWPAEAVLSVSVIATTAAEADALATAFYVMGPENSRSYCDNHPDIGFVMACPGARAGSLEVHCAGIPAGSWEVLDEAVMQAGKASPHRQV
jgi:thiamine biosynthesis lipoprotein